MQIVIEIPREIISDAKECFCIKEKDFEIVERAIINGKPLLKGHGRIVNISKIEYLRSVYDAIHGHITWQEAIKRIKASAPTIIEADNTKSEFDESTEDVEEYDREVYCDEELCSMYYTKCADCPATKYQQL